jgi:hypothetical protein
MNDDNHFQITHAFETTLDVELDGNLFRIEWSADSIVLQALADGERTEELRAYQDEDLAVHRVAVRDGSGLSAVYSGRVDGDLIYLTVEVSDGQSYRVDTTAGNYSSALNDTLRDATLPQIPSVLSFATEMRRNSRLRESLQTYKPFREVLAVQSVDCVLACDIAAKAGVTPAGTFAAGYCVACVIHGW